VERRLPPDPGSRRPLRRAWVRRPLHHRPRAPAKRPDPWAHLGVPAARFGEYVAEIEREAERARERYGLLVVPGWRELEALRGLVNRFELINGHQVYGWVAEAQLPAVATGDFHRIEHLVGRKTLLPCASDERQVVACLRSAARLHLTPFSPRAKPARLAA
jgi:hypothetical protein